MSTTVLCGKIIPTNLSSNYCIVVKCKGLSSAGLANISEYTWSKLYDADAEGIGIGFAFLRMILSSLQQ